MRRSVVFVCAAALLAGCGSGEKKVEERMALTAQRQRSLAVGVMALWVDDCGGLAPEIDVDFPNRLTSPIPYITADAMQDPFGKPGERLYYLPAFHFRNTGTIAIISRGPDGMLESRDLPKLGTTSRPIELPDGTPFEDERGVPLTTSKFTRMGTSHHHSVARYQGEDGEWHDNPTIRLPQLPTPDRGTSNEEYLATVRAWFVENGVHVYDPTNGLKSRGDVIRFFP